MVIMAPGSTEDYSHFSAHYFDPADPVHSSLAFFAGWTTHFFSPAFSFLAGISACMACRRRITADLSSFLTPLVPT